MKKIIPEHELLSVAEFLSIECDEVAYCEYLNKQFNFFAKSMSYNCVTAEVRCDPINRDVGYTDGRKIVLNYAAPFLEGYTRAEKTLKLLAILAHEIGHVLYSDTALLNEIMRGDFSKLDWSSVSKEFENWFKTYRTETTALFGKIQNIGEDPYVEARMCERHTGNITNATLFNIGHLVEQLKKDVEDVSEEELPNAFVGMYLLQARGGLEEKYLERFPVFKETGKLFEEIMKKPYKTQLERFNIALRVLEAFWKAFFKDKEGLGEGGTVTEGEGEGEPKSASSGSKKGCSSTGTSSVAGETEESSEDATDGTEKSDEEDGEGDKEGTLDESSKASGSSEEKTGSEEKGEKSSSIASDSEKGKSEKKELSSDIASEESADLKKVSQMARKFSMREHTMVDTPHASLAETLGKETLDKEGEKTLVHEGRTTEDPEKAFAELAKEFCSTDKGFEEIEDLREHSRIMKKFEGAPLNEGYSYQETTDKCSDIASYFSILETVRPTSRAIVNHLKDGFKIRRRHNINYRQLEGDEIDLNAFATRSSKNDLNVFLNLSKPNKMPLMSILVLVDLSGSMSCFNRSTSGGTTKRRIESAREYAVIVENFASELRLPCAVYGHNAGGANSLGLELVKIHKYLDFKHSPSERSNLVGIYDGGNNRDGYAIRVVTEKLLRERTPFKVMVILSDGEPAAFRYSGTRANEDTTNAVIEAEEKGIHVLPFNIGDESTYKDLLEIYQDRLVDCSDPQQAAKKIATALCHEAELALKSGQVK